MCGNVCFNTASSASSINAFSCGVGRRTWNAGRGPTIAATSGGISSSDARRRSRAASPPGGDQDSWRRRRRRLHPGGRAGAFLLGQRATARRAADGSAGREVDGSPFLMGARTPTLLALTGLASEVLRAQLVAWRHAEELRRRRAPRAVGLGVPRRRRHAALVAQRAPAIRSWARRTLAKASGRSTTRREATTRLRFEPVGASPPPGETSRPREEMWPAPTPCTATMAPRSVDSPTFGTGARSLSTRLTAALGAGSEVPSALSSRLRTPAASAARGAREGKLQRRA